jgi:DNA repair exonuclease SbcCD ATPase subunit
VIKFSALRFKNFLSSGNAFTTIQFDAHPTTLVVGKNGSGKSTMLDALCFVLFGKPFRNINKPQLVNSVNQKNCVVEIEFTIGRKAYKIIRGIKPAIFEIYQDGVMIDQDSAARDYQKHLEENILKLNFKSFTQIVILGVASFTPFMKLPAASRREIIEDILDIRIFTVMNTLLKEKVSVLKETLTDVEGNLKVNMEKTRLQDKYIKSLQADRKQRINELTERIKVAEDEIMGREGNIREYMVTRDTILDSVGDSSAIRLSHTKHIAMVAELGRKKEVLTKEIAFYEKHDTCPTCKQGISHKFCEDEVGSREKMLDVVDYDIMLEVNLAKDDAVILEEVIKKEAEVREWNNQIAYQQGNIDTQKRHIDSFIAERSELEKKGGNIEAETAKLREMASEVLTMTKQKATLKEEKDYHDVAVALLKDGGVKTRIIKQYLPAINKMVNKYLHAMDFFVSFELNEQFSETIKSRHRDEFSYESFSQGEKQRIDLALVFTWRTIAKMKNSTSTNLLILDEVFDSSLDADGTDYVVNLLKVIGEETNVWVISHKPDIMADKFNNVLHFVKKNNYSILDR